MSINPGLLRVPGTGEISVAPAGTAEPPDAATALPAAWTGLGLSTQDGVSLTRKIGREAIQSWQQITPVRYIYTSHDMTLASVFQETKAVVLGLYFGGLRFTETAAGSKKYRGEIAAVPGRDVRAVCIDWTDRISATEVYAHRLFVPRAEVTETADVKWTRTAEAQWGMTFTALAPTDGSPALAVWLTNDPAVAPPGGQTFAADKPA